MTELKPEIGKTYEFISDAGTSITATVETEEARGVGFCQIRNPDRSGEPRFLQVIAPGTPPRLRVKNAEGTYLLDATRFAIVRELPETKEAS